MESNCAVEKGAKATAESKSKSASSPEEASELPAKSQPDGSYQPSLIRGTFSNTMVIASFPEAMHPVVRFGQHSMKHVDAMGNNMRVPLDTEMGREERQKKAGGVQNVPGRVMATLQRKFWDSNKIVSDNAVLARDFLAEAYVASKEKAVEMAGATVHNTLQAYKFARDRSTAMELPGPLKPVRDHIIVPSFRGVERSVDFILSPRLGQAYQQLKEHGANVPLVGRSVLLPSVEAAEGVTRFVLVALQAPLPSAESVANVAEVSMNLGKRGLRMAFRELYFYMDLIDQQVTRTMTRAQWDILGNGPYADLPRDRREEVVDRACEKYLSLGQPIQRYEFLAHIRWHNAALHDDLVQTGTLRERANSVGRGGHDQSLPSPFAGDAWLDPDASWRRAATSQLHHLEGVVVEGVHEKGVGWFWRKGSAVGGEGDNGGPWKAFSSRECRRLERGFRRQLTDSSTKSTSASSPVNLAQGLSSGSLVGTCVRATSSGSSVSRLEEPSPSMPTPQPVKGGVRSLYGSGGGSGKENGTSVAYQPTQGLVLDVRSYEVQPDDVLVDQGRHAVTLDEMVMRPVFWPFSGQADEVCRAVWMQDTGTHPYPRPASRQRGIVGGSGDENDRGVVHVDEGPVGLEPYPLRAAAILEDAYQFLAWYLGGSKGGNGEDGASGASPSSTSPTVLLTVQVADQLVQFRSLTDILCVKRTLGGAFSVFGRRRVFRGVPAPRGGSPSDADLATTSSASPTTSLSPSAPPPLSSAPSAASPTPTRAPFSKLESTLAASSGAQKFPGTGVAGADVSENEQRLWCHVKSSFKGDGALEGSVGKDNDGADVPIPLEAFTGGGDGGGCEGLGVGDAVDEAFEVEKGAAEEESADAIDADLDERVEHLVLVVHGIGDALMSVDLGVVQLRSLVECCDTLRAHHEEVVLNSKYLRDLRRGDVGHDQSNRCHKWHQDGGDAGEGHGFEGIEQQQDERRRQQKSRRRRGMGRVEYLPVEWHTRFKGRLYREARGTASMGNSGFDRERGRDQHHNDRGGTRGVVEAGSGVTQGGAEDEARAGVGEGGGRGAGAGAGAGAGGLSIWDITLPRAPTLRAFTNDTLLDILYFMSPEYHQVIVEEVTQEINRVLELFRKQTRCWNGKVSIVAHSLGAIICFDIMANQPPLASDGSSNGHHLNTPLGGGGNPGDGGALDEEAGGLRDYQSRRRKSTTFPRVSAPVENLFCLGSPIGMFLMIRGQHRGLGKSFKLPGCRRLFNIFHPYDPVAFRLEPLLRAEYGVPRSGKVGGREGNHRNSSPGYEEPVILPTWTGGLRVHYQVQRWWQELWGRACDAKRRAEEGIEHSLEAMGLIDEQHDGSRGGGGGEDSRAQESLFGPSSDTSFGAVEHALGEASIRAKAAGENCEAESVTAAAAEAGASTGVIPAPELTVPVSNSSASLEQLGLSESHDGAATATVALDSSLLDHHQQQRSIARSASTSTLASVGIIREEQEGRGVEESASFSSSVAAAAAAAPCSPGEAEVGTDEKERGRRERTSGSRGARDGAVCGGEQTGRGEKMPPASDGGMTGLEWMGAVMEEDVERNGAIAGGRRVDYCLQEKEFEVTNEYIFALGSHVIYWSSKDVSLFVAHQVFADALAASDAPGIGQEEP